MNEILHEQFKNILLDSPLVGEILLNLRREITDAIPTAAIGPDRENGGFKMMVNMEFFTSLETEEQKAVIWHEVMHIVQKVFTRMGHLFNDKTTAYLANIAADCSINQYNKYKLPKDTVTLESVQKMVGDSVVIKPKETSEYYYQILKTEVDKRKKEMESKMGDSGEGGEGGEGGKSLEEMLQEYADKCESNHEGQSKDMEGMNPLDAAALDSIIKKAIEKQKKADLKAGVGAGGSVLDILPTKNVKINRNLWKNFINKSMGESKSPEDFDMVYGLQNRRDTTVPYGKRRNLEDSHLTVIIDTSGSMTDEELGLFCGHLNKAMRSENLTVDLIECDAEIQKITHNIRKISKKGIRLHGRGGTDLTKAQKWVLNNTKRKKNDILMFTDGYTDFIFDKALTQRVLYTKNHSKIKGVKQYAVIGE